MQVTPRTLIVSNAAGGVNGQTLRLIALDDGYEPQKAGANVRKLIDEDKVFAILGDPGTPTAAVAVPIAHQNITSALTGWNAAMNGEITSVGQRTSGSRVSIT